MAFGEIYGPAMVIEDQVDADLHFEKLVWELVLLDPERDRVECERIVRENLAYFAGYYDGETRARVERLFSCEHPIFGAIAVNGRPTAEEAFQLGVEMGKTGKILKWIK